MNVGLERGTTSTHHMHRRHKPQPSMPQQHSGNVMAKPYLALYLEGRIDLINNSRECSTTYWLVSSKRSSGNRGTTKGHSRYVNDSLSVSGECSYSLESKTNRRMVHTERNTEVFRALLHVTW